MSWPGKSCFFRVLHSIHCFLWGAQVRTSISKMGLTPAQPSGDVSSYTHPGSWLLTLHPNAIGFNFCSQPAWAQTIPRCQVPSTRSYTDPWMNWLLPVRSMELVPICQISLIQAIQCNASGQWLLHNPIPLPSEIGRMHFLSNPFLCQMCGRDPRHLYLSNFEPPSFWKKKEKLFALCWGQSHGFGYPSGFISLILLSQNKRGKGSVPPNMKPDWTPVASLQGSVVAAPLPWRTPVCPCPTLHQQTDCWVSPLPGSMGQISWTGGSNQFPIYPRKPEVFTIETKLKGKITAKLLLFQILISLLYQLPQRIRIGKADSPRFYFPSWWLLEQAHHSECEHILLFKSSTIFLITLKWMFSQRGSVISVPTPNSYQITFTATHRMFPLLPPLIWNSQPSWLGSQASEPVKSWVCVFFLPMHGFLHLWPPRVHTTAIGNPSWGWLYPLRHGLLSLPS